jgi:hypothetical protein
VAKGKPLRWDQQKNPIRYTIHTGTSAQKDADLFIALVRDAFRRWSSVKTAELEFSLAATTGGRAMTLAEYEKIEQSGEGGNAVIMDVDGDIIATLAGPGSRKSVHGWGLPVDDGKGFVRFFALINAHPALAREQRATILHEVGHVFGLDHSQITATAFSASKVDRDYAPVMFPWSFTPPLHQLRPDDEAWVSTLYPSRNYKKQYGRIQGQMVASKGTRQFPVRGANVVAVGVADEHYRVSCVSDYLGDGTGAFALPVKAGKYRLYVEPIRDAFFGSSGVGIHAQTENGFSFVQRVKPALFGQVLEVKADKVTDAGQLRVVLK